MNTAIFFGILSLMAMGTLIIAYVQHTCGIACYEIKYKIENLPK